jgi:hypothetical protein
MPRGRRGCGASYPQCSSPRPRSGPWRVSRWRQLALPRRGRTNAPTGNALRRIRQMNRLTLGGRRPITPGRPPRPPLKRSCVAMPATPASPSHPVRTVSSRGTGRFDRPRVRSARHIACSQADVGLSRLPITPFGPGSLSAAGSGGDQVDTPRSVRCKSFRPFTADPCNRTRVTRIKGGACRAGKTARVAWIRGRRAEFARGNGGQQTTRPCSPGWTRTSNPSVNSRMLCQLSYRGLLPARGHRRDAREDFSARPARAANTPPARTPTGK